MEEEINEITKIEEQPKDTSSMSQIDFYQTKKNEIEIKSINEANNKATELVGEAFSQAVVAQVQNNTNIQEQLFDSAGKVIASKTNAIKSQAELEDKQTNFNNKKGACECFGYNETTTEKWAVNYMNIWHNIMTGIWVTIGMFTFAPITFIAKKVRVIVKASWVAILLALLVYLIVIGSPIWIKLIKDVIKIESLVI